MIVFSTKGKITADNSKTNIVLPFDVPSGVNRLVVKYSYSPKTVEDKVKAISQITKAMEKYNVDNVNASDFLPVNNLVTLSFDDNGVYRGACHRQANNQEIIISSSNSTAGVINAPINQGQWNVVLNVHYAGCDIDYTIQIEGE
jgi:hypothetical protein